MARFLHSADWQLGMTRHFLSEEAQARFTAARIDVIATIGALARAEHCDFVVVGGDVFESNQVERQVVVRSLEAMRATPDVTFYLLAGNHDPLDAASVMRSRTFVEHRPPNVVVIEDTQPLRVAAGLEIVGAPWPNKRPLGDLLSAAVADLEPDGTVRIALGHGAVDSLSPDPNDPALIMTRHLEAALGEGRIHYVALGDRHSTTDIGTTGRIWYSGAPEPTDFDEIDPGNVLVVDVDGASVSVQPRAVATWRFVREHYEVAGSPDVTRVQQFLDDLPNKARTIVKLSLVGQLCLRDMARLDDALDHAADLFAAVERWERRSELVALPDDDDFAGMHLSGFAAQGLEDLGRLGETTGAEAQAARDALGLLWRLAEAHP